MVNGEWLLEVFFEVLSIDISRDSCRENYEDRTDAKNPDEEGCDQRNPDVVTVYLSTLCHPEDRNRDERHDCRTDASEEVLHPNVFPELLEHECDGQDAQEGGQASADSTGNSAFVAESLIADEDADVHGKDARTGLSDGNQVEQFFVPNPMLLVNHLLFDERNHCISAPDSKEAYLKESLEKLKHVSLSIPLH